MTKLLNTTNLKQKRRLLRKNQTVQEKKLWNALRNRQLSGMKFIRQYSVGPYILDFYCSEKNLGIELDGSQHMEPVSQEYDKRRSEYLKSRGIEIFRFGNNDIDGNFDGVIDKILEVMNS